MLQKYSSYKLLQEFFNSPKKNFQMRELSRKIKLAQSSVINHLNTLAKEKIILKEKKGIYPSFRANRENEEFKLLKKQNLLWRIHKSKLLDYLEEKIKPDCIILFGSASKGEDTEESDIDLFIQAKETSLNLENYEKTLNRKINPLFEAKLKTLNKELLNNLINGQVLYGYLQVF